jgi:hypothetical protein
VSFLHWKIVPLRPFWISDFLNFWFSPNSFPDILSHIPNHYAKFEMNPSTFATCRASTKRSMDVAAEWRWNHSTHHVHSYRGYNEHILEYSIWSLTSNTICIISFLDLLYTQYMGENMYHYLNYSTETTANIHQNVARI